MTKRAEFGRQKWQAAAICLLFAFALIWGGAAMAGNEQSSSERRSMRVEDRAPLTNRPSGAWQAMLRFDHPAVYEYRLWKEGRGRTVKGSLTIQVTPSYTAFSYELNGVKDGALAQLSAATPGEQFTAALLASGRWDSDAIRLLWTPFMITRWADEFARMPWRTGIAWATRSGYTEQFVIERILRDARDNTIFRGSLKQGSRAVMDIDINLDLPLPEYISWVDRDGTRYSAEIVASPAPSRAQPRQIPSITGK